MTEPQPLPDHLVRRPFPVHVGRDHGLTAHEMRTGSWTRPHHGVRAWAGLPAAHPYARAMAVAPLLPPGAALTGWAAAWLHGVRELDGHGQPVHVALPEDRRVRRPGVATIRSALATSEVVIRDGVPVTGPLRCAFDLARLGTRTEGVVGVDAMLAAGLVARQPLTDYVRAHPRTKGVPQVRRVLALAAPGVASPMETRLRLLWLAAGLPFPRVNVEVRDLRGRFLGRVDLLDEDAGLVGEYDGAGHRRPDRHAADNRREEALESAGLVVVRFTAQDVLASPDAARVRLRRAWERGRARDRRHDAWTVAPAGPDQPP
jgi:hypothetical protein